MNDLLSKSERAAHAAFTDVLRDALGRLHGKSDIYSTTVRLSDLQYVLQALNRIAPPPLPWIECSPGEALDATIRGEHVQFLETGCGDDDWRDLHAADYAFVAAEITAKFRHHVCSA